jgi:hypothetical protein
LYTLIKIIVAKCIYYVIHIFLSLLVLEKFVISLF